MSALFEFDGMQDKADGIDFVPIWYNKNFPPPIIKSYTNYVRSLPGNYCWYDCNEHDIKELESYYDAWIEKFSDCFTYCFPDRMQYVIANNKPYQIIEDKENCGEDIFNAKKEF